jgi:Rrf2 family protein
MFSNSCEYGLRAIIFIAQQTTQNNKVSLSTISEEINSPKAFTAKILQKLTRNNIVKSIKGPYGGFEIEKDKLETITLSDVVVIFDGDTIYTRCGLGLTQCNENSPCPMHYKFIKIREELKNMLESTTLLGLLDDLDSDLLQLKLKR